MSRTAKLCFRMTASRFSLVSEKSNIWGEALFKAVAHFCTRTGKVHRTFGREYNARNPARCTRFIAKRRPILVGGEANDGRWFVGHVNILMRWTYWVIARLSFMILRSCQFVTQLLLVAYGTKSKNMLKMHLDTYRNIDLPQFPIHLRNTASTFRNMSSVDCWNYVNDAAKTVFGKSIMKEIEDDYVKEEAFISTFRGT